jgi:hypothetical protein
MISDVYSDLLDDADEVDVDDIVDVPVQIKSDDADRFEDWMAARSDAWICEDQTTFLKYVFPSDAGVLAFKMAWDEVIQDKAEYGISYSERCVEFSSIDLDTEAEIKEWVTVHTPGATLSVILTFECETCGDEERLLADIAVAFP